MHFGRYRVGCEGAGGFFRGMIRQKIPMPERPSTPAPELLFFAGEKKKPWRTFGGGAAAWGDANYIYLCIMEEVFEDSLEATCTGRILMLSPHNFFFFVLVAFSLIVINLEVCMAPSAFRQLLCSLPSLPCALSEC